MISYAPKQMETGKKKKGPHRLKKSGGKMKAMKRGETMAYLLNEMAPKKR